MTYPSRLVAAALVISGLHLFGADEIQRLNPLVIEAPRYSRPYLYCEVAGFQILSPFTEEQTKDFARELLRQRALLNLVISPEFQARYDAPLPFILDDEPPWNANEIYAAMDAMSPGSRVEREEAARNLEQARSKGTTMLKGATYSAPDVVIRQSLEAIRGRPKRSDQPASGASTRTARAVSTDSVAFYLDLYGIDSVSTVAKDRPALRYAFPMSALYELRRPRLPEWVEDVIGGRDTVGIFRSRFFEPDGLRISPAPFMTLPVTGLTVEGAFADRPAIEPSGTTTARRGFMYVFATWALLEDNAARARAFWQFVDRATAQPVTEAVFAASFGPDGWKELQRYWGRHTDKFARSDEAFPAPKGLVVGEPQVRPATRAESVRIRSEYEWRIAREFSIGDPTLGQQGLDQAGVRLRKAYDDGERDPRFLAVLALWECDTGKRTDARLHLEQAAAAKVVRPSVYFELARLRLAEERAKLTTPDGKLDGEQTRRVLEPLEVALTQHPALNEVYQLLTEVWARSAIAPTRENLAALAEGVRLFPRDPVLAYKVGMLHAHEGAAQEAADIATQGLRFAANSDIRARLLKLQETARPIPTDEARPH
jgi:hypothetical protein